ncbi:sulfatase-like hydrolase/transferase [Brachybacterium paraconglomeratum]|uniref:sulfatase-like hydrolase/transferase n=1 Tax=Brachybacterium paraconglomeratum TaxID=173362 RepID=UPI003FD4B953
MATPATAAELPAIVLFVADDLGHADDSYYGATALSTPVVDGPDARGHRFTDVRAASAKCTPSRYTLLTGQHAFRSPLRSAVLGGTDGALVAEDAPTLTDGLREFGYLTAAIGSWHLRLDWTLRDNRARRADPYEEFRPAMEADGWEVDYSQPFQNGPLERGFDHFDRISGSLDIPQYCVLVGDRAETDPTEAKSPLVTSQHPGPAAPGWEVDAPTASDWSAPDGAPDLLPLTARSSRIVSATAFGGSLVLMGERGAACYSTGPGGFDDSVGVPILLEGDSGQFFDRVEDPQQRTDIWETIGAVRPEMAARFLDETGYGDTP